VLVHFPDYRGPTEFFSDDNRPLVPITPITGRTAKNDATLERTQLPFKLAWAITIHKSQSLSLDKLIIGLGKREFSAGLSYVALSRAVAYTGIALDGPVSLQRLLKLGGANSRLAKTRDAKKREKMPVKSFNNERTSW
jgi:ATP-dependent DNA helicase PIF1